MKWDLTGTWRIIHVIYEFVIRYCCAYFSCFEALSLTNSRFLPSSRRYSPGWALASSTTSLHCSLSFVFSIHCLIFITFKSATTSSVHPSRTRSSSPSSYKQSSFHQLPWHRSHFHSLYMSQPSYPLSVYEFHNILSVYGSIQFFIISNSPNIPLLVRPIDPPQCFPFEDH
jgi:hypothetical protein